MMLACLGLNSERVNPPLVYIREPHSACCIPTCIYATRHQTCHSTSSIQSHKSGPPIWRCRALRTFENEHQIAHTAHPKVYEIGYSHPQEWMAYRYITRLPTANPHTQHTHLHTPRTNTPRPTISQPGTPRSHTPSPTTPGHPVLVHPNPTHPVLIHLGTQT